MPSLHKQNAPIHHESAAHYSSTGEMGKLIDQTDWASTSIGPMENWPQSLKTTLGIILHSKFPMFLFWGDDLLCFYNDAYRPGLGNDGKHPWALGKPGAEVLPEMLQVIKPLIDQVLAGGESTWSEDQLVPIYRNGKLEEAYWTFGYSAVIDESGKPGGVLVNCVETTNSVENIRKLEHSKQRFQNLVSNASVGIMVLDGPELNVALVNKIGAGVIEQEADALVGKPIFDVIPELEAHFRPIIESVLSTGKPVYLNEYPYALQKDGENKEGFLNLVYQPFYESSNTISGVMILSHDVTEQVSAKKQIEQRDYLLKKVIEESSIRMSLLIGEDMRVELVNDTILEGWQKTREEVLGKPISEVLPEMNDQPYFEILDKVYRTGQTHSGKESPLTTLHDGKRVTVYVDYWCKPILNPDGKVYGVLITSVDVTEKVIAQKAIAENEHRFRDVVESAPFPIGVYTGEELTIQLVNQALLDTWGKGNDVVGKTYIEVLPEIDDSIYEQIRSVLKTGIPFHAKNSRVDLIMHGELKPFYFNYSFTPLFDSEGNVYGVMNTAADVTDVNVATQKAEQSKNNLRNTILQAPVAMCIFKGRRHMVEIINERMLNLWGKTHDEVVGKEILDGLREIEGQGFDLLLDHVYATGQTYKAYDVPISLPRENDMETVYVDFVYEALRDDHDKISGVIAVATDVTEQVVARQKTEQAEENARLAIESADLGKYEVNLATNEIRVSDRFNEIWGVELSLPRPEYASYIHPDDMATRMAAHEESLKTGNLHYEARVIWDDKSVHWIRVKGKVIFDDNGQPLTLLGVVQDINDQKLFAEELQKQVRERTAELHRSNEDLLHFAHVASHDLKEPVRKIKVFGNMLADEFSNVLPERGLNHLRKMQSATDRMFAMIDGVLSYSTINSGEQPIEKVDLNKVLDDIETDLEIVIQKKNAVIKRSPLPVIEGASVLLYQLFYNLINNALKFSKADRAPLIAYYHSIISKEGVDYMEITIADNGIGLEQQYAEQIFNAFARLHGKDQYEGTGLGLSLCKKIVERHHGSISATGVRDEGAVFTILLPVKQKKRNI